MRIKLFGMRFIFEVLLHPNRKIKWLPAIKYGYVGKPTYLSDCGCERVMHECSEKDNCRMLAILRKAQEK